MGNLIKVCRIYQKPVMREKSEGDAILIVREKKRDNSAMQELGLEAWKVKFLGACGTSDTVIRFLYPQDIRRVQASEVGHIS